MKLVKVASLATQKCWWKKYSDEIGEDSNSFNGIADCAKENRHYKAMLAHFKLFEISNNEIYELIPSEYGDNLLDDPK